MRGIEQIFNKQVLYLLSEEFSKRNAEAIPFGYSFIITFAIIIISSIAMERGGVTYILTNDRHTVLYTGVTSDLVSRMYKHIHKIYSNSFTGRYNVHKLVYFEIFSTIEEAIAREKQIKAGSRNKKEERRAY